jgi:putative membrane protein
MKLSSLSAAASLLCLLSLPLSAASNCPAAGSLSFTTTLSGSQFGGLGSPNAFGNGTLTIDPATNQGTLQISTAGLGSITGSGLFLNTGGTSQQVLPFTDASNTFQNGSLDRAITLTPALINQILANPSAYSFQVATGDMPNGALTGQLMPMQSFGGSFSGAAVTGSTGATTGGGSFSASIAPNASGTGSVLNYSFVPTGIGSSITGLELRQGTTGTNGSLVTNLSGSTTLTNGRVTGSVPLTTAQAQQLMTNPSGFYLVANNAQFPAGAIRSQFGAAMHELYFPVAGSVAGAAGNRWETDLEIFNTSSAASATVMVELLPTGQSNNTSTNGLNASNTAVFTVAPRSLNSLTGSIQSLFNLTSTLGALRITSDQPLVATARIYDDQRTAGRGTTGAIVPAQTLCDAVSRGVLVGVTTPARAGNAAMRTNVGFFNPNATPVTVNFNLGNEQGVSIGTTSMTLPPFSQSQMALAGTNALFGTGTLSTVGGALSFQATAPIFAYASMVDNTSGDTSLVMAQEDLTPAASLSDAEILGIVNTANQGEVQVNTAAQSRLTNAAALAFAQRMIAEHSAALTQSQQIAAQLGTTATPGPVTTFLTAQTQQTMAQLQSMASGPEYDRAYIQSQITTHQLVLSNLDQVLIPSARTPLLRNFLQIQRDEVADHLQTAQQILQSI